MSETLIGLKFTTQHREWIVLRPDEDCEGRHWVAWVMPGAGEGDAKNPTHGQQSWEDAIIRLYAKVES